MEMKASCEMARAKRIFTGSANRSRTARSGAPGSLIVIHFSAVRESLSTESVKHGNSKASLVRRTKRASKLLRLVARDLQLRNINCCGNYLHACAIIIILKNDKNIIKEIEFLEKSVVIKSEINNDFFELLYLLYQKNVERHTHNNIQKHYVRNSYDIFYIFQELFEKKKLEIKKNLCLAIKKIGALIHIHMSRLMQRLYDF